MSREAFTRFPEFGSGRRWISDRLSLFPVKSARNVSRLLKNTQTEMTVPPAGLWFIEKKWAGHFCLVGSVWSGFLFFNRLLAVPSPVPGGVSRDGRIENQAVTPTAALSGTNHRADWPVLCLVDRFRFDFQSQHTD